MIFIDSNQYLDLYRTASGKKLLAALREQKNNIFVTKQVSEEVQRRKVGIAAAFLAEQFKKIGLNTFAVPDHLFGSTSKKTEEIRHQLKEIGSQFERTNDELKRLASELLDQISRSEDEVSKTLAGIFARAVPPAHSDAELQSARMRRERGNPPGKRGDPLVLLCQ
jgi:PIN like domain